MSTYGTAYTGFPTVYKQYTDTVGVNSTNSSTKYLMVHTSEGALCKKPNGSSGANGASISSDPANYKPYGLGELYDNNTNRLITDLGMIGVGTESSTGYALAIKFGVDGTGSWSSGGAVCYVASTILMRSTSDTKTKNLCAFENTNNAERSVIWNHSVDRNHFSGKMVRTYFGYQNNGSTAISSICGFTIESYNSTGSLRTPSNKDIPSGFGVHADDSDNYTVSLVIARMVSSDKTNANVIKDKEWSDSGLIVFSALSNRVYCNLTDGSSTTPAIRLTQAISQNAMASNVGMTAVAVMATASGATYHLGCKNGIYKIYNGPNPYVASPGTHVAIGKKEFISIAYGSYYARIK